MLCLLYLLLIFIILSSFALCPNRVEKSYLKSKYANYSNFTLKNKIKVLKLYRLEKELKENRMIVKNLKKDILECDEIW